MEQAFPNMLTESFPKKSNDLSRFIYGGGVDAMR